MKRPMHTSRYMEATHTSTGFLNSDHHNMPIQTPYATITLALAGDADAMQRLVEVLQPHVYNVALKLVGNHQDAQDVCQDTLLRVSRRLKSLRNYSRLWPWVTTITKRLSYSKLRHKKLKSANVSVNGIVDHRKTTQASVDDQDMSSYVLSQLNKLCDIDKESLIVFYLNGLSIAEMSVRFGVPVGTIKRRLHVARNRLRELLNVGQQVTPLLCDFC